MFRPLGLVGINLLLVIRLTAADGYNSFQAWNFFRSDNGCNNNVGMPVFSSLNSAPPPIFYHKPNINIRLDSLNFWDQCIEDYPFNFNLFYNFPNRSYAPPNEANGSCII